MDKKAEIVDLLNRALMDKERPQMKNALDFDFQFTSSSSGSDIDSSDQADDSTFLLPSVTESDPFEIWFVRLGFELLDSLSLTSSSTTDDLDELFEKVKIWQSIGYLYPQIAQKLSSYGELNLILTLRSSELLNQYPFDYYTIHSIGELEQVHKDNVTYRLEGINQIHQHCFTTLVNDLKGSQTYVDEKDKNDFTSLVNELDRIGKAFFAESTHGIDDIEQFQGEVKTILDDAKQRFHHNHFIRDCLHMLADLVLGFVTLGILHGAKSFFTGSARFFKPEQPEAVRQVERIQQNMIAAIG